MEFSIKQLKNGDERVFRKIVESYWVRLYKFSLIYIREREVAKEIVQDTFIALWDGRADLHDDTCLITYLMIINRNKCLNYLKSLKLQTVDINVLDESSIYRRSNINILEDESLEILIMKELHLALEASINRLPVKTREIFLMSRYEGLKNREIAIRQNLSVKTVEFHINKALKQLRDDLSSDYSVHLLYLLLLLYIKNNFNN